MAETRCPTCNQPLDAKARAFLVRTAGAILRGLREDSRAGVEQEKHQQQEAGA